jgi:hypothetical protein
MAPRLAPEHDGQVVIRSAVAATQHMLGVVEGGTWKHRAPGWTSGRWGVARTAFLACSDTR